MTNRLVERFGQRPWFSLTVLFLVILRVTVLPFTAHAFDEGAMASIANRLFIIGSSPLMHCAKSPLFGVPYVTQYALFLKIVEWLGLGYNPHLELLLLKIPTLIAELLIAILILKIVVHVTQNRRAGRLAVLLWLINPTAFRWGSVSGHYGMFGVLGTVLALYLASRGRQVLAMAALSVHAAMYYYPAVLLPLFLLFFATETQEDRNLWAVLRYFARMTIVFGIFCAVQVLPLLVADGGLFRLPFLKGLLYQASPSQPFSHSTGAAQLADFSWYTWPYKAITGLHPDAQNAPILYDLAHWITAVGPILAVGYILWLFRRYLILRRGEAYAYKDMVADSFLVLTLALVTFSSMHESYILWLMPFSVLWSALSSDYRLAALGLVMGTLNQFRGVFYLSIWERAVPLTDILQVFPWRITLPTDPALSGFVVMLMLLPFLAILRLPRQPVGKPKVGFAPIGLCVILAMLTLLCVNVQALVLCAALLRGNAASRTAQLDAVNYQLVPIVESTTLTESQDLEVQVLLVRNPIYGDEEVVRRYVYGVPYRRFFEFRLFFPSVFRGIKSVKIGSCQPAPLGIRDFWRLRALGGSGLTYDFAPCLAELGPSGFPIPVSVVFDKDISVQDLEHRIFALARFIPQTDYLPERTWLVNALAVISIGVSASFFVVVRILMRG